MFRAVLMAASKVSRLCSANRSRWGKPSASRTSYSSKARLRELSSVSDMAAYLCGKGPESKCGNGGRLARLIWVMEGQNADEEFKCSRMWEGASPSHILTAFRQLADGHQAGVTTGCCGVDAQRTLDHQTLQGNCSFALGQTMHPDNRPATLGHLLANRAQLIGVAVVQDCVEHDFVLGPVGHTLDLRLNLPRQAWEQGFGQLSFRPYRRTADGQYRRQLGQQVAFHFRQAQHVLAGQDGVAVAFAGRTGQQAGDTALRLRGEPAAQGAQFAERVAVGPGFQGGQRLAHGIAQAHVRCGQCVTPNEGLLDRIGRTRRQQAVQVQRTTGFRAGARQAFAAKRLHADHGPDNVAVDVDVTGMNVVDHLGDGLVDARVYAQRQAVAGSVDLADQLVDFFTLVAHHVQHWAEDLPLQLVEAFQFDQGWHHEGAALDLLAVGNRHLVHRAAFVAHGLDVLLDAGLGLGVDHRADIHRQTLRVAQTAFSHGALEHFDDAICRIFLQAQDTQGRATLAGTVEGRRHHVDDHLFGQGRGVDDHRVLATGFGDQRNRPALGIQATGDIALQQACDFGGTGEHHAFDAIITDQTRTDGFALARQQLQHAFRNAGFEQDAHRLCGHQWGLLGRLGQYRVTGGQCGSDLTAENRQREVPRADADHRAQWAVGVVGEIVTRLHGVVTQEVHGFTHFGDGVGESLAGFTGQQAHQRLDLAFHQVGGTFEDRGTLGGRCGLPDRTGVDGALDRVVDVVDGGFLYVADHITQVGRVQDWRSGFIAGGAAQHRRGFPVVVRGGQQGAGQRCQTVFVGQVDTGRVGAVAAVQVTRQWNTRVRQAEAAFQRRHLLDAGHWIGHQLLDRDGLVGNAVDERGVGAVFQQATYQVGQQGFVGADRCVHAARTVQLAIGNLADYLFVQRFAHAVQALELVLAGVIVLTGDMVDGRQGVGVVRGELRVDDFRHRQQFACAGNVGHVGVHLAGVDRVAFQPFDLGALDFAVPVRAFYQADHQAMAAAARQVDDVVDHIRATLLVGLDHETDAVPAGQLRLEAQAFEQVQGQFQAVGFFGVDVQADVVLLGQQGQGQQARVQLVHHAFVLGAAITRVQGRQLDGNARAFINPTAV